jgi:hypothetical protein
VATVKRLRVMPEKCSSCIFGPNSPIRPGRFEDLREQWERKANETYQVCHQTSVWDPDDPEDGPDPEDDPAVCRGWYDEMYLKRGVPVQIIQIAERLGLLDLGETS